MIRNIEELTESCRVEDADPSDSNAFAASGKPEVLNGTNGGIKRRLRHGMTAEPMSSFTFLIAQDAEILRGFEDPFKLEIGIVFVLRTRVAGRGLLVGYFEAFVDGLTNIRFADHNKPRRLHQSHGRGTVGSREKTIEDVLRQWNIEETA